MSNTDLANKIYCRDCRHFKKEGYIGIFDGFERPDCTFVIKSKIIDKESNQKITIEKQPKGCADYNNVLGKYLKYKKLNKNNNCKFYKRKWYKF